jgi:hypothetical protein
MNNLYNKRNFSNLRSKYFPPKTECSLMLEQAINLVIPYDNNVNNPMIYNFNEGNLQIMDIKSILGNYLINNNQENYFCIIILDWKINNKKNSLTYYEKIQDLKEEPEEKIDNNNNNNDNKENKNIELNKINVDKIKQFNKIKNSDIFKYSFLGCCYSKSKTHNIIKECDKYVTKHISIEEIFYNMLLFENFIEDYKFKDNNNLKKFEEIKNKIDFYEKEMELIDENDTSNKNMNNININLIDKTSNFSSINES